MTYREVPQTVESLEAWDWHAELQRQERSQSWLGRKTGKSPSAVNAFRLGRLKPSRSWLEDAAAALGVEVRS